jgi:hypothetical protein
VAAFLAGALLLLGCCDAAAACLAVRKVPPKAQCYEMWSRDLGETQPHQVCWRPTDMRGG